MKKRVERAQQLFREGFNCSQSVFAAFGDLYGVDRDMALKLSTSFGGGVGRMREFCGAVSGMCMIADS
jgi:C_GCAxxG_C_C family probable redox protein